MSSRLGYQIREPFEGHFLTCTVVDWLPILDRWEAKKIIIDSWTYCTEHKGLRLYAYVIMSNHIHFIAQAKQHTRGLAGLVQDFKRHTSTKLWQWLESSQDIGHNGLVYRNLLDLAGNGSKRIWQPGNGAEVLKYPRFTMQEVRYIHNNPVRAEIVTDPAYYYCSSAAQYEGLSDEPLQVELLQMDEG